MKQGARFCVPRGQMYSIKNELASEVTIIFVINQNNAAAAP
jgi:hypothetical protein